MPAREIAERSRSRCGSWNSNSARCHKAGLVESFRGAGGGCRIARDPAEITVAQIADAIEGQIFPMFCLEPSDHTCFQDSQCGLQGFWADVARAAQRVFDETTVADLGPPPTDEPGAGVDRPGNAVVSFPLTRCSPGQAGLFRRFGSALLKMRVSFVPQTGQAPCAAGRPFFRVTI